MSNPTNSNSIADQVRARFESLHRQPELASDMECFRPGGELHSIRFIAHPHSVHVERWLKLLSHTQASVTIDTANPILPLANEFVAARPLVSRFWKLPMILRYLISGFRLRIIERHNIDELVHAHCASGNGFVAWLSGRRYVIGCYGSEIFGSKQRGPLYCWLMRRILQNAERVSALSSACTQMVVDQFGVPAERVYCFHLGYDDLTFRPLDSFQRHQLRLQKQLPADQPIWVVNRRTHPHYRTLDVVQGFLDYCELDQIGRLVVLCGDNDPEYTRVICERVRQHPSGQRITVVQGMLPAAELASWLQLSDFSISVPRTDSFSLSTLESLGCATVPILANLEAYKTLRTCSAIRWMRHFEPSDFTSMFADTRSTWSIRHERDRLECLRFVSDGFSTEDVIRNVAAFYLGKPLNRQAAGERAA